jgi:hypothetical protein
MTDQAILATLTATERKAIAEAVPAWIEGASWISRKVKPSGSKAGFPHETADEIMARHGITFGGDRARYMATEREIRARAYKRLGVDPRGRAHNARGGLAKVEPGRRRDIARMGGLAKAARA